ncbi:integrase [Rhizobium lentis]|uniref:integrase n=1 Tax=Rhizobium lentis TaxID=1138194 RepID=UPI001C838E8D|nr:integrase [Rhizobium lentis]MBX4972632.1 integrase [Rhizobium lentis]MBX5086240.1 integrase [Rhizobium lentis]MBX5096352.1 integrase [Rhizobium lentis]MBX5123520.1 integrase [Rhizobium lentis]
MSLSSDRKYLELHGNQWRVVVNVPKKLHAKLGTKLKKPLGTDSLREANRLKWDALADLKATIAHAENPSLSLKAARSASRQQAIQQAVQFAEQRRTAFDPAQRDEIDEEIDWQAESLAGRPIATDEGGYEIFDPERLRLAKEFAHLARGDRTPIDLYHEKFLAMSHVKARTQADDKRAIKLLKDWCSKAGVPPYLQAMTKKEAVRFCDELPTLAANLSPVTLNKYVSRLSVYWTWLENRHEVDSNIWQGRRLREPQQTTDQKERPFTDDEVKTLLEGPAEQKMHDLMRIAALSGARLDAIVCLKVKDCRDDGVFVFKPQKKEPGPRLCPIHPDLIEIVDRRKKGKAPEDDIFPEWPGVKKSDSLRERSFKTSNEFTAYRRIVGVEDRREGKRRGLVNFHSFRRWFITKAEQAGQLESTIAVVVGHKRQGMTFGVYSGGPLLQQARECVEAVRLPPNL